MQTKPRACVPFWLFVVLAASACGKKEQPGSSEPVASATSGAAAPEKAAPPVDADTLTLQYQLGDVPVPAGNPQTKAKIELGHQLFFDKRLSVDGSRSCYGCHQNEDGNGGHDPVAIGVGDKTLTRHSPVIWNVGYAKKLYWDGRSGSLQEQCKAVLSGGNMGLVK